MFLPGRPAVVLVGVPQKPGLFDTAIISPRFPCRADLGLVCHVVYYSNAAW